MNRKLPFINDVIVNHSMATLAGSIRLMLRQCPRASAWACRRLCSSENTGDHDQPPKGKEITVATSSLRIDTVAAAGLDIARRYIPRSRLHPQIVGGVYTNA